MARRPGGELAYRPLHFFWLCDCSGSMSVDGKIQSLNSAVREALPHMQQVADQNPNAQVFIRTLKFSHGAEWLLSDATALEHFRWQNLEADPVQAAGADIVFLMDTTGSMQPYIDGLIQTCVRFADSVGRARIDAQLGLIGFGDLKIGESMSISRLTTNIHEFQTNVRSIPRTHGGDEPESSLDALREGLALSFRPDAQKVLVLITDASPHEPDQQGHRWQDVANLARAQNALVYCIAPDLACWRGMAGETGAEWFPIEAGDRFLTIIDRLGQSVAREVTKRLASGVVSGGTDMGAALQMVAAELKIPPMTDRALPPVLVLISDGQPTDDFNAGLHTLMAQPWGKKAVRVAIGIGGDADLDVLQQFIGHMELRPLAANNPEALARSIKWVSTAVLQSASAPASQAGGGSSGAHVALPAIPDLSSTPATAGDVW